MWQEYMKCWTIFIIYLSVDFVFFLYSNHATYLSWIPLDRLILRPIDIVWWSKIRLYYRYRFFFLSPHFLLLFVADNILLMLLLLLASPSSTRLKKWKSFLSRSYSLLCLTLIICVCFFHTHTQSHEHTSTIKRRQLIMSYYFQ
jgi:hypothetical protein